MEFCVSFALNTSLSSETLYCPECHYIRLVNGSLSMMYLLDSSQFRLAALPWIPFLPSVFLMVES